MNHRSDTPSDPTATSLQDQVFARFLQFLRSDDAISGPCSSALSNLDFGNAATNRGTILHAIQAATQEPAR